MEGFDGVLSVFFTTKCWRVILKLMKISFSVLFTMWYDSFVKSELLSFCANIFFCLFVGSIHNKQKIPSHLNNQFAKLQRNSFRRNIRVVVGFLLTLTFSVSINFFRTF